jgi:tRNA-specific 2-thiouridylase
LDEQGKTLGHHDGIHHYTIGQRHGIPVESTNRTYVRSIDGVTGDITITHDPEALASKSMSVSGLHWLHEKPLDGDLTCQVQGRYRSKPADCLLHPLGDGKADVTFASTIRAVTPGQAAVFYEGDRVLGRGWIDAAR